MVHELDMLLLGIRDGVAEPDELARARALLASDERVPDELRGVLDDDPADAAAALLAVLGVDDGFGAELGRALADEIGVAPAVALDDAWAPIARSLSAGTLEAGGRIEVAAEVASSLGEDVLPVAEAVEHEAGRIEIAAALAAQEGAVLVPVAEAVVFEAGPVPDIAADVHRALDPGDPAFLLADAVRAEAGACDLADAVQREVEGVWVSGMLDHALDAATHRRLAASLTARRDAMREMTRFADTARELREALRLEAGEPPAVWAGVAAAIGVADPEGVAGYDAALVAEAVCAEAGGIDITDAVVRAVRRPTRSVLDDLPAPANRGSWGSTGGLALAAVALLAIVGLGRFMTLTPTAGDRPETLNFASAAEIVVDDLSYDKNAMVQVVQTEGDEGALIIWIDEEAML